MGQGVYREMEDEGKFYEPEEIRGRMKNTALKFLRLLRELKGNWGDEGPTSLTLRGGKEGGKRIRHLGRLGYLGSLRFFERMTPKFRYPLWAKCLTVVFHAPNESVSQNNPTRTMREAPCFLTIRSARRNNCDPIPRPRNGFWTTNSSMMAVFPSCVVSTRPTGCPAMQATRWMEPRYLLLFLISIR